VQRLREFLPDFGTVRDIVYDRLAPGVLEELKHRNPKQESGRRRHKYFQWLTTNTGYPKLREHLGSVVAIMKLSEMSPAAFTRFLKSVFRNLAVFSLDGSIHFVCMDWRHLTEILKAGFSAYTEFKNLCIWIKDNGGMGTFYRSRHELIFAFKSETAPHINSFELGQHGRYRTNVWQYRGMNWSRRGLAGNSRPR
jgi:hypothetical protein